MEDADANKKEDGIVPSQFKGSEMNAENSVEFPTIDEAIVFFEIVKERLLNINQWSDIAVGKLSKFYLTDGDGNPVDRKAEIGDHIKIDIPGPGNKLGDGYDWVTIELIKTDLVEDGEVLSVIARPSANPLLNNTDTAHFLTKEATSTFQVKRIGTTVFAEEHGRNEVVNAHTDNAFDNLRNTLVGWGAKIGFSYPQWKSLVSGLLKQESK